VKFGHCKDLTGEWDMARVIEDTYYECAACKKEIRDHHKRGMCARGEWRPTNFRTLTDAAGSDRQVPAWFPRRMSAHYSDLYSQNENVAWGRLAL
jgi:phage terminase large subunit GpA-like protein